MAKKYLFVFNDTNTFERSQTFALVLGVYSMGTINDKRKQKRKYYTSGLTEKHFLKCQLKRAVKLGE